MPEGDTLFRTAAGLRMALLGRTITRFGSSLPEVTATARRTPPEGRTVAAVEARGKHLLIVLRAGLTDDPPVGTPPQIGLDLRNADLVLRTHLRMTGSWHIYRHGEPWRKPAHHARVVLHTRDLVVPCFSAPVVELFGARELVRHSGVAELGPDAMTVTFDAEEALRRLRRHPEVEIGVAIMNQRILAGVGNVYKSEALFLCRLSPFTPVRCLSDEELRGLLAECHRLLRLNGSRGRRRTYFGLREADRLWAYQRAGEPCRVCGSPIRVRRQGLDLRTTYYCLECQGGPAEGGGGQQ